MFTKLFSHIKPLKVWEGKASPETYGRPRDTRRHSGHQQHPNAEALSSSLAAQHHHGRAATSKAAPLSPCRATHEGTKQQNSSVETNAAVLAARQQAGIHPSRRLEWLRNTRPAPLREGIC